MNPLSLRLLNVGVFRGEHTIQLPEGLVGILGDVHNNPSAITSNGAGKSTFVSAIVAALFGVEPGRPKGFQTFAPDVSYGEDRMEIELTFSQGDDVYRVRRSFTVKGGTKLDLERCIPAETWGAGDGPSHSPEAWEPLTRESIDATQSLIDRTIGFTRSMFIASALFTQKGETFPTGKKAMELLAEAAFGLEPSWPVYAARANTERKGFEIELQQLEGRTQAARELVATKAGLEREHEDAVESETVAADVVADREREHVALAERWQAAREQDATRKACEAEVREASSAYNTLAARGTAADDAARQIVAANERLAALGVVPDIEGLERRGTELSAAVVEHERALTAHRNAVQQAEFAEGQRQKNLASAAEEEAHSQRLWAAMRELDETPADEARCDRCQQILAGDARSLAIESMRGEANQRTEKAEAFKRAAETMTSVAVPPAPEGEPPTTELASARADLTAAMQARTERATLAERIELLTPAASAGPSPADLAAAYETVREKEAALAALPTVDIAAIEEQGRSAKSNLDAAKLALQTARSLVARLDERRVQMTAAEQALAEAATKQAELHRAIDTRVRLEKACGLNGVRTLILETAVIPFMEAQTAAALTALGTPWQVELRTQREKKDGGLVDTLDIVVQKEDGDAPYWKLSGGEEYRVAIALRVALSALMPGRSELFCIDEPRWLDSAGIEALVESLRGLLGRYARIYCVTQSGTALRDSFDSVLVVQKDGGASRVLDGYAVETEAVAA